MANPLEKLNRSIGAKLIALIAALLFMSVVSLVWLSTRLFVEDNTTLIQQMNADTASSLSAQTRELFSGLSERSRLLGSALSGAGATQERIAREVFGKDQDLLGVFIHRRETTRKGVQGKLERSSFSMGMSEIGDPQAEKLWAALRALPDFDWAPVFQGEPQIYPVALANGSAAIFFSVPFIEQGGQFSHVISTLVRQERVLHAFSENSLIESFLVDRTGRLLVHADAKGETVGQSVANLEIVQKLLSGKFNNGQTRYQIAATQEWKLGAFHSVGFAGMGVVSDVPEEKVFEAANRVKRLTIYLAIFILSLAFFAGYYYSGTITGPIRVLVATAKRISQGDFKIDLKPKGQDEIASLSTAFNEMAKGLEERDRVKETFNKFHNKEIAEKLLSGEVKLGGERKAATVFFSDIRGFTAMSEKLPPEEVVDLLNEYMTRMVSVIRKHGGIVDKYIGDAIMALWGVPISGKDDSFNALKACLEMRKELVSLNEVRVKRGQNALKIGMGLNVGQVIAGNIGSDEKMEYTVIGDTVNTASRMESMTKEYGVDLLVPAEIYHSLKDRFIFQKLDSMRVKGKADAIDVYSVKGFIDGSGAQVLVETPYSAYTPEKSDKSAH